MQIRQIYTHSFNQFNLPDKKEYIGHIWGDFGDDWCMWYKIEGDNARSNYQKGHFVGYIVYDLDLHWHRATFMSKCLVCMRNRLSTLENPKFDTLFMNFGYILPDLWEKVE